MMEIAMKHLMIFFVMMLTVCVKFSAHAQSVQWETLEGPWTASKVTDFAVGYQGGSRVIYAVNEGGNTLLKSTNDGAMWGPIPSGNPISDPVAVACEENNPSIVYVGREGQGVWKSTDGGGTFNAINVGLENLNVSKVAISPHDTAVIYAGCAASGSNPTVFRSTNGGGSWSSVAPFDEFRIVVTEIVFDPTDVNRIWISGTGPVTTTAGVWRSDDGGRTWQRKIDGMSSLRIGALTVDPSYSDTLYAGTYESFLDIPPSGSVYRSTHAGDSWSVVYTHSGIFDFSSSGERCK
jgi:photosystem II stability/assembly factor-like uncharacterized protein